MPSYKAIFLERWAILNLAIVVAMFMAVMGLKYHPSPNDNLDVPIEVPWMRLSFTLFVTAILPINGAFLMYSLFCSARNSWGEHRFYWLFLLTLGVAWVMFFFGAFVNNEAKNFW